MVVVYSSRHLLKVRLLVKTFDSFLFFESVHSVHGDMEGPKRCTEATESADPTAFSQHCSKKVTKPA